MMRGLFVLTVKRRAMLRNIDVGNCICDQSRNGLGIRKGKERPDPQFKVMDWILEINLR